MPKNYEKVFVDDLENDEALKLCSDSAKWLWVRMFLYMGCKSPEQGLLLTKTGSIPSLEELSRIFSETKTKLLKLISELEKAGVFSRNQNGAIACRRQIRERELSEKRAAAGHAAQRSRETIR